MQVELAVEPEGAEPRLEIPWKSTDPEREWLDLREDPRAIARILPTKEHPPLRAFLVAVNGEESVFVTARCCTWRGEERDTHTFTSEIDLILSEAESRFSRKSHQELAERVKELLEREEGSETVTAELAIRRCRFRDAGRVGDCLTVRLTGRGDSPQRAEMRWSLGLMRVQQALLFVSRALRQGQVGNR